MRLSGPRREQPTTWRWYAPLSRECRGATTHNHTGLTPAGEFTQAQSQAGDLAGLEARLAQREVESKDAEREMQELNTLVAQAESDLRAARAALVEKQTREALLRKHKQSQQQLSAALANRDQAHAEAQSTAAECDTTAKVRVGRRGTPQRCRTDDVQTCEQQAVEEVKRELVALDSSIRDIKRKQRSVKSQRAAAKRKAHTSARAVTAAEARVDTLRSKLQVSTGNT